jgi:predicted ATPase
LREFGIGDEINFSKIELFAQIKTERNGLSFNFSDEGFGVSKLFQLIIQILNTSNNSYVDVVNIYNPSVLLLEEPESGLHPALQSKLAEFFFEAYQLFNIQFIIETHSEYLIRKLQTMTADTNCNLTPKHTQMYYFYNPDSVPEGEQQVYPINIEEDGSMTRPFGKGFYDESTNLNIALYNYSKVNKN